MERRIVYFDRAGPENTAETLRIVRARAEELGFGASSWPPRTGGPPSRRPLFSKAAGSR
jgi:hypothetical protein